MFGDPTYGDSVPNGNLGLETASKTTFDKLQYGTRNLVARYNATLSPTWLFNASWTWGHNNLNDTPFSPDVYNVIDYTQRNPCGAPLFNPLCTSVTNPLRGQFTRQGLGYYENTKGDNYGLNFDTQKTFNFLGQHSVSFGYKYDRSHYDGTKARTGPQIAVDAATAASATNIPSLQQAFVANGMNAAFQLRTSSGFCGVSELVIPGLADPNCGDGGVGVYLLQVRGEFGNLNFKTTSLYHTIFAQDAWSPNKYVTINAGLRWEQQHVAGVNSAYTFNDNWSPRLGISVDPWGNRKTKVTANFGRYTESLPLDIAIRSLSSEYDSPTAIWTPNNDGAGHALVNADGTLDMSNFSVANNLDGFSGGVSGGGTVAFGKGARSEYLDEFQLGFEHEFGNSGVIFTTHYTDRRIKRIIEDNAALSPEAFQAGLTQQYFISNPNKSQDLFINPQQFFFESTGTDFTGPGGSYNGAQIPGCGKPGATDAYYVQPYDSNGNIVTQPGTGLNAMCVGVPSGGTIYAGGHGPGDPFPDGIPDGFVDPVRKYQAVEFEVNKSFSRGWQMRANYRIAKLFGNYEGSYRNDNGQNDPNISSLFDFTRGDLNLLGQQFTPGVLNTDVRHMANGFVSYTFSNHMVKGLTMGSSVHFQTGTPINNLFAHPAYQNAGEIPFCADNTTNCTSARGALGRTKDFGQVDYHVDYPIRITEGTRLRLAADLFNLANSKTLLRVDQFAQRSAGVGNADFGKPTGIGPSAVNGNTNPGYLRPFYARLSVKFEF